MIDSLPKNVGAYVGFFALSVLVGVLESVHVQFQAGGGIDPLRTLDAAIASVLPSLVLMLGAMKLPGIGNEAITSKVAEVRENLEVVPEAEGKH